MSGSVPRITVTSISLVSDPGNTGSDSFVFRIDYGKWRTSGCSTRQCVNAGSVGKPKDGDSRACYIVLTADGDDLNVEFHRVEYDIEHIVRSIEDTEMPDAFAEMLRTGTS